MRRRTLTGLTFLVGMASLLAACSALVAAHHDGIDDAYISYRYAGNLANGYGLVFNPGERVEGYSNLLYVLMLVPAYKVGAEGTGIYRFSVGLNVLAAIGVLVLLSSHVWRRFGAAAGMASGLLLALCPAIWYWVASGMESVWVLLFQVAAWVAVDRLVEEKDRRMLVPAAASAVLMVLVRADGFLVAAMLVLYLVLRKQWRYACWLGAASGMVLIAVLFWQWRYYGQALANPYYVKVGGPLLARLKTAAISLARSRQMWLYWLALGLYSGDIAAAWARAKGFARVPVGMFMAAGLIACYLYIGGDFFGERFLLFCVPLALYSLFALRLMPARQPKAPWVWAVSAVVLYQLAVPTAETIRINEMLFGRGKQMQGTYWAELGRFLGAREPGKVIAVDAAGRIPFFSGLHAIDMLGLCDAHIAHVPASAKFIPGHSKYDAEYILQRQPDLIAAWAVDEQCNLAYDLARSRWSPAYAVTYMLYAEQLSIPAGWPYVADVRQMSAEGVALLYRRGYRYVVLKRTTATTAAPTDS